jgi:superfamily I DNA/RNA helicase
MFETNEMIYRYGINFIGKTSVEWLTNFKKLIKRENDKNTEKANNQISILLTLYDLYLEYQGQFKEKLELRCKTFNTTFSDLTTFLDKYKNEISEFKNTYNPKTLNKNLKFIRDNKKMNFYMNSGTVKISTIHSFKGWECENLFLIIEKRISISFDEILYTGITRSRTNLIIINYGNTEYNDKLNDLINRVK